MAARRSTAPVEPQPPRLEIRHLPTGSLVHYASNPRRNDPAVDRLVPLLREFGLRAPLLVHEVDGRTEVVDGHLRLKAATKIGLAEVPVVDVSDLSEAQIKALRLAMNKSAEFAEWDDELLAAELRAIEELGLGLDLTGFGEEELARLLNAGSEGLTDPDDVPDPPADPVTRLGDVWLLGRHRLACGDSTERETVERALGGVRPDLANCDPPYGLKVVRGGKIGGAKIVQPNTYAEIIGDDTTETAVACYHLLVKLGVPIVVLWGGNYFANELPPSRCWLVWDKENTGTFADAELAWTNQDRVVKLIRHQWSGLIKASERGESRTHPTQKPIALAAWVIATMAPKAEAVLDCFLGSGWTLMACEKMGIRCCAIEMAPGYVDVSIKRWENATGQEALLEESGLSYSETAAVRLAQVDDERDRENRRSGTR